MAQAVAASPANESLVPVQYDAPLAAMRQLAERSRSIRQPRPTRRFLARSKSRRAATPRHSSGETTAAANSTASADAARVERRAWWSRSSCF